MSFAKDKHSTEEDEDRLFLDQVLNKLYDFGKSAGKRKSKTSQKRKSSCAEEEHHETNISNSAVCENTASETQRSSVEVVTFIDPQKKNRLSKTVETEQKAPDVKDKKKTDMDTKLAIEKARFEVHRFGLSGYQKQQQRVFEQDRAIMLGAAPPKKQFVNYKVYQEMIKEKKLKEREEAKSRRKRNDGKKRFVKSKWSIRGQLGGQVGRFKNGMLVLSSKDIQKVNKKK